MDLQLEKYTLIEELMKVKDLKVPLYMGHGLMDNIVPHKHLTLMKEFIDFLEPDVRVVYHTDSTATHNYTYWNSEVDNVLEFFQGKEK